MIVRVDGRTYHGRAVDLHGVDPDAVASAIRDRGGPVAVRTGVPGPLFERVGVVSEDRSVALRTTLAAAARSLGWETPHDGELADIRAELAAIDPPAFDATAARKRAAAAREREDRLHERVARLRGRVRTLRDRGEDAADAEERLHEAAAELTEARTERIAAEEKLDRTEKRRRAARDRRERRLVLEDRLDNRRRSAREHLAERVWDRFGDAVDAVPGDATAGPDPDAYAGDDCTAALAALRVGDPSVPAVLSCGRFADAASAADCLRTPVVRVGTAPQ